MARYFFNLDECGTETLDVEGRELDDLEAARHTAIRAARAIMCEEVTQGRVCFSCRIIVTDAHGLKLLGVPFTDAVEVRGLSSGGKAFPLKP